MLTNIIRRIIFSIPVIIVIALVSFLLIHMVPGSPAAFILGTEATRAQIIQLEHEMRFAIAGMSIANFWLALNLMWLFGVKLRCLPVQGFIPLTENFIQSIKHLVLPAFCLGLPSGAFIARMTRSSMLEVIREDYIRTAKAKGLKNRAIYMKHAFKNAFLPIITIVGMICSVTLGGTIIIENIFNIPGLGKLFIMAIQRRDFPVIQAGTLYMGVIFILMNLIVDIIYLIIDPRIQHN